MLLRLILIVLGVALGSASAQQVSGFHSSKRTEFDADRTERFEGGSRYLAEGNVVITQPGVILRAQRMELTIDPESNEIELLVARGRVRYATVEGDAVAGEYARYSASNDLLVVRTNVVILQEGQVATGDQLVYNTVTGAAEMTGGEGGRVRGLIPGKQGG